MGFLQLLELFKRNKSLSFVLLSIYQPAQSGFLLAFSVVVVVFEGRCCFSPSTAFAACMYVPQNTG
jgi:hypothetical protein